MADLRQSSARPVEAGERPEDPLWRFIRLWRGAQRPDLKHFLADVGELQPAQLAAILRFDQCERWRMGDRVPAEIYLRDHLPEASDSEAALDFIYQEFLLREELGEAPTYEEYVQRFPNLAEPLRQQFELHRAIASKVDRLPLFEDESKLLAEGATISCTPSVGSAVGPKLCAELTKEEARYRQLLALFGVGDAEPANSPRIDPPYNRSRSGTPSCMPLIAGYEIHSELGRGGMGVVYEARQVLLDRVVALKLIPSGAHAQPENLARFRLEAEAVARLQHSNIVQVYEVGEQNGCPYLALEYVDGGNLQQKVNGTPLPPRQAAEMVAHVARAVSYAHQRGIVHRDLKPTNILLTADGSPKIADFGLAKRLDGDMGQTRSGAIIGTPSYMAPEQAEGNSKDVGPGADVYSLGTILYELLTGRPPFRAPTLLETLEQVRSQDPVSPRLLQPNTPRDLEAICLKCLEKEPRRRFLAAQDLADDLDRFLAGEPTHARNINLLERATRLLNHCPVRSRPASANLYPYFAPLPLLSQLLLFMAAGDTLIYPVVSLVLTVLCMLITVSAESRSGMVRPEGLSNADMRHFWSAQVGFLLGVLILPLVSYLMTPAGTGWNPMTVYPLWSVLAGVCFIYLASIIWGRLYAMGVLALALSLLMAFWVQWGAVLTGLAHSIVLAVSAVHLYRISPVAEPGSCEKDQR